MPVEVIGVDDVLKGLNFFDEDLYNRIRTVLSPRMKRVEQEAKSYVPNDSEVLSGWAKPASANLDYRPFPKYNSALAKGGIGYKEGKNVQFKNGFQVENYVYNVSAAGRIYETAGRRNPQGRAPFQSISVYRPGPQGGVEAYNKPPKGKQRGSKSYNSSNPFAGYQFVTALEPVTSQPKVKGVRGGGTKTKGRLIYKAFANQSPKIYQSILNAINDTAVDFNKSYDKKVA